MRQRTPRPAAAGGSEMLLRVPPDSEIPSGPLGVSIRRGRALLAHTRDSLPDHAPSALRCFSCHLLEGTVKDGFPLVGVYSRFPQFRQRNGMVNLLEDRVNDCFERSLSGKAIPRDGKDMRDIMAFLGFISRGVPPPGEVPGAPIRLLDRLPVDTAAGARVFAETCVRCHGADGAGTPIAPPLWGSQSFSVAAGLGRLRIAAAFIKYNMPNDRAVVLTEQQAHDVAGYVLSRPRPDFPGKALDWPNGDVPDDVPYPTRAGRRPAPPSP